MKLACRFCEQYFHDVEYGDSWTEPDGRHHFIVAGPAGLLSGQKSSVTKVTCMEDFIETEPQPFEEIGTEQEANQEETVEGLSEN
jgi:hypothetical protein